MNVPPTFESFLLFDGEKKYVLLLYYLVLTDTSICIFNVLSEVIKCAYSN